MAADDLGLGGGSGVDFGFAPGGRLLRRVKRAARKAGRAAGKVASKAGRAAGQGARAAGRGLKKAAKVAGKTAASYAAPALKIAMGQAAKAGCSALGIPGALCEKGGEALGKAIGKKISQKVGVPVRDLPVDPQALIQGDPKALIVLGRTLAANAGLKLPSEAEAMLLAATKAGLPPQTLKAANLIQQYNGGGGGGGASAGGGLLGWGV